MIEVLFDQEGDFAAVSAAEQWCKERGISVGRMQRNSPRGLKYGDFDIAKWHNLGRADQVGMDGQMTSGDMRAGPVLVVVRPAPAAEGGGA